MIGKSITNSSKEKVNSSMKITFYKKDIRLAKTKKVNGEYMVWSWLYQ